MTSLVKHHRLIFPEVFILTSVDVCLIAWLVWYREVLPKQLPDQIKGLETSRTATWSFLPVAFERSRLSSTDRLVGEAIFAILHGTGHGNKRVLQFDYSVDIDEMKVGDLNLIKLYLPVSHNFTSTVIWVVRLRYYLRSTVTTNCNGMKAHSFGPVLKWDFCLKCTE